MSKYFLQLGHTAEGLFSAALGINFSCSFLTTEQSCGFCTGCIRSEQDETPGIKCQQTTAEGQEGRFHIIGRRQNWNDSRYCSQKRSNPIESQNTEEFCTEQGKCSLVRGKNKRYNNIQLSWNQEKSNEARKIGKRTYKWRCWVNVSISA